MTDPADIIRLLDMRPHPEGGHFVETWRDGSGPGADHAGRGWSTAIYFLLQAGERSHWHRVDAAEAWHHYAGAPLELTLAEAEGAPVTSHRLGKDLAAGERPQFVVPAGHWQAAQSLGAWTLVGCTVAPAFRFEGFELAPPDWHPSPRTTRDR